MGSSEPALRNHLIPVQIGLASILSPGELIEFYDWSLNERGEFLIFEIFKQLRGTSAARGSYARVIICKACITCICT
jgi:hypothetical protein